MRRGQWVIERLLDNGEWDTIGSVVAPNPSQAVEQARARWSPAAGHKLRAVLWDQATLEQRDAAEYEDKLRYDLRELSGAPGTFGHAWAQGDLPLSAKSPAKAKFYHRQRTLIRVGVVIAIVTLSVLVLLFAFARPTLPTLIFSLVIAAAGGWSSFSEARSGQLDGILAGDVKKGSSSFGFPALFLVGAVIFAAYNRSWLAAIGYVVFFFLGALAGILLLTSEARLRYRDAA